VLSGDDLKSVDLLAVAIRRLENYSWTWARLRRADHQDIKKSSER